MLTISNLLTHMISNSCFLSLFFLSSFLNPIPLQRRPAGSSCFCDIPPSRHHQNTVTRTKSHPLAGRNVVEKGEALDRRSMAVCCCTAKREQSPSKNQSIGQRPIPFKHPLGCALGVKYSVIMCYAIYGKSQTIEIYIENRVFFALRVCVSRLWRV